MRRGPYRFVLIRPAVGIHVPERIVPDVVPTVKGNAIAPSTTNRTLAHTQFEKAYERSPLSGPGQLQDLQGPSYLFAILTDPRVAEGDPPT